MDSRIREIEQWIAEAKQDLGECGQEAYVKKLFLLDAEIRAILRENGILPGAVSPRHREKRVRRFFTPALALGSVLGAALLTTTVYLFYLAPAANPAAEYQPAVARAAVEEPASEPTLPPSRIPDSVNGESILLADGWQGPQDAPAPVEVPAAPASTSPGTEPAAPPVESTPSAAEPWLLAEAAPVANRTAASSGGGAAANDATDVMLSYEPEMAPAATEPVVNTPEDDASPVPSSGFRMDMTLSRFEFPDENKEIIENELLKGVTAELKREIDHDEPADASGTPVDSGDKSEEPTAEKQSSSSY